MTPRRDELLQELAERAFQQVMNVALGNRCAKRTESAARFIVRLYDGMDNQWIDVSDSLPYDEANKIWLDKTANGTRQISFDEIDYYNIFPADTEMVFSNGFGER